MIRCKFFPTHKSSKDESEVELLGPDLKRRGYGIFRNSTDGVFSEPMGFWHQINHDTEVVWDQPPETGVQQDAIGLRLGPSEPIVTTRLSDGIIAILENVEHAIKRLELKVFGDENGMMLTDDEIIERLNNDKDI